jgi:all-trans-retinol dehydrogenase (NAD+)
MQIRDKTILITGAARGIGQEIAVAIARSGGHIIGADLPEADWMETQTRISREGRSFAAVVCDVTDADSVRLAVTEAARNGFDGLVNNAGVLPSGPFLDRSFSVWQRAVEVNTLGTMQMCHAALPHLLSRPESHIVNIASVAGKIGSRGMAAYCASKHGVVGLSSALRFEYADSSVRVSCVIPSMVNTRLSHGVRRSPLVPMVEPGEVGAAVVRAISRNLAETYVPRWTHFLMGTVPGLFPPLYRWLARHDRTGWGWLDARKPIYGIEPEDQK